MTWIKLNDDMPAHPKIVGLSDKAFRLHIAALCHCGRYLTDGRISRESVANLARIIGSRKVFVYANQLVSAGLWVTSDPESHGFVIHDYLDVQRSKGAAMREREEARERMREIRAKNRSVGTFKRTIAESSAAEVEKEKEGFVLSSRPKGHSDQFRRLDRMVRNHIFPDDASLRDELRAAGINGAEEQRLLELAHSLRVDPDQDIPL